jgi:hypothetical protein
MKAINKAILDRLRGDETLTPGGRAAQAQTDLIAILGKANAKASVLVGGLPSSVTYPCVRFWEDAGTRGMGGEGVGDVMFTVYRFEMFCQGRDGTTLPTIADCLELLLDERRDAPPLTLAGDGRLYGHDLLTNFQGPFQDTTRDCFIGTMAFRFAEARP